jgi:hypothetical protein
MDGINILIEWIKKRLFPISIAIFVLIYIWWFRLTPWNPSMTFWDSPKICCTSNVTYRFGLILLIFYAVSGMFWRFIKSRGCFGTFFRATTIFFFTINSWYITLFVPRIIDVAKYNGIMYYLVSYYTGPDQPSTLYQLTKWHGMFNYEIRDMDRWVWKGKIFYDQKTNLVNIVTEYKNHLSYTDDIPPRYYEHDSRQLGNYLYYVSSLCNSKGKDLCVTYDYAYAMYECELDNTACAMLPFRYTGEGEFNYLEVDEKTKEVGFYVWLASEGNILAYSYGEQPRCYVEGCEILESTK